jgi:hypothetical protein
VEIFVLAMTDSAIKKIRNCQEIALDFADWLSLDSQKQAVIQIFDRGKQEIEQGDVLDLDSIE